MTRNETILGLVALVLVVFSLVVSLVVPRRNPGFPGKSLRPFLLVAIFLVAGMLTTVEVVGGEEEVEAAEVGATEPGEPAEPGEAPTPGEPGEPAEPGEAPTPGEPGEPPAPAEPPAPGGAAGDAEAGSEVFASAGCGSCHTLAAAGSNGNVGPNLDEAKPPLELVVERVTNGKPPMPSFRDQLTEQQIADVAAYVVASTSSG
jgi:mono/diheme cytochrome c family protein